MIKHLILALFLIFSFQYSQACTNFLVGKSASTDGSTFISYNADSYYLFGALYHYSAGIHSKGTMRQIYDWDSGKHLGEIPEAEQTYNVIGNMNEFQVSIGETTYGGREELVDTAGIMDYGSLIYVALQRSKTAREAIKVMTDLVEKYGYCSEGESFSIADPNEVWILEMIGKGAKRTGAVWVALRIPDDCISAHANQARITNIPFKDKKNCMYSKDVVSFAREKGYFTGKDTDFSFSDTYAPLDYSALRACEARVWSFFRQANPEMDKFITYIKGETKERMPLWIKPSHKISLDEMKKYMRDTYEGTELALSKGLAAGPFGSKLRCRPLSFNVDSVSYINERPISTQQTGFSFVAQMRSWMPNYVGGILWFGVDDTESNIYVPMYCCVNTVPPCFDEKNGSLLDYSPTSAFWIYNTVANFAYLKYQVMMEDIREKQNEIESGFESAVVEADKKALTMNQSDAIKYLTDFSYNAAETSTGQWKKLGEFLLVKYMDGVIKKEKDGKFIKNSEGLPPGVISAGYPDEFNREMVKENPDLRVKTKEELEDRK